MSNGNARLVTKSVRLSVEDDTRLRAIAEKEYVSEGSLIKKWVMRGLHEYTIETTADAYRDGRIDLASAASQAGLSVTELMGILERKSVPILDSDRMFWDGLRMLADTFGASAELQKVLGERTT